MKIPAINAAHGASRAVELAHIRRQGAYGAPSASHAATAPSEQPETVTDNKPALAKPENAAPSSASAINDEVGQGGHGGGVIRLLEEGHFKGVADVRLRINFFDELSTRAAPNAVPAAQEESAVLVETLKQRLAGLAEAVGADEAVQTSIDQLTAEFDSRVAEAVGEHTSGDTVDAEALAGAIRSVFENLLTELGALLQPEPAAPPADSTNATAVADDPAADPRTTTDVDASVPSDGIEAPSDSAEPGDSGPAPEVVTDPAPDTTLVYEDALTELTSVFDAALSDLLGAIAESTQLPDPSPPTGHGTAYEKFLAIYNDLRGLTSVTDQLA